MRRLVTTVLSILTAATQVHAAVWEDGAPYSPPYNHAPYQKPVVNLRSAIQVKDGHYYKPCADLLSPLKNSGFEKMVTDQIQTRAQLAQVLSDFGLIAGGTTKRAIGEILVDQKVIGGDFESRPLSENPREVAARLIQFAAKSDDDLRAIVWPMLEKIKLQMAANSNKAQAHVAYVQVDKLVNALHSDEINRGMTEKFIIDLLRVYCLEAAKNITVKLKDQANLSAVQADSIFFHSIMAPAVLMTGFLMPFLVNGFPPVMTKVMAIGAGVDFGVMLSRILYSRLFKKWPLARRVKVFERQIGQALTSFDSDESLRVMANQIQIEKNGVGPSDLAVSIHDACHIDNICDLSYNQIAYAGQVDLIDTQLTYETLLSLEDGFMATVNGLPVLAAAQKVLNSSRPRDLIEFRQGLMAAPERLEGLNSAIENLARGLDRKVNNVKQAFRSLQQSPFEFKATEKGDEALNKKELLLMTTKASISTIDKMSVESLDLDWQISVTRAFIESLQRLANKPVSEEQIRGQAEDVIMLFEKFNYDVAHPVGSDGKRFAK